MARIQELRLAGGNKTLLLLAIGAGLVAALLVFVIVSESDGGSSGPAASSTLPAVVASANIGAGTEITADMVTVAQVPEDLLVSGAKDNTELVVGEVSRVAIAEGEQITSAKLGLPVPEKGASGIVPAGLRAVAVEVDEVTAVGGLLLPGDHVDIIATVRIDGAPGLTEDQYLLRTQTVLQNVEVLSVAQEALDPSAQDSADAESDPSYASGELPDDVEEQPDAGSITLALTPEQAQLIISQQEHAVEVAAILRAFGDQTVSEILPFDVVINEN